ncbi:MAG: class I SAM-dependent methyltransferase [Rhodothermales bacterium]
MRKVIKFVVGLFVPHSLAVWIARTLARRRGRVRAASLGEVAPDRGAGPPAAFDYEEAVRFLVQSGMDRQQIEEGSMPEASLHFCAGLLREHLVPGSWLGLHIGNFVGLSLAYLTHRLTAWNAETRIVSIDPNIPHRGIERPLDATIALLRHYGLHRNNLILTGYSLEKNVSNDGFVYAGYDPLDHVGKEGSCEHLLDGLVAWSRGAFHFCLIDGNHEAEYLRRELVRVDRLLRPGGLLILDDVTPAWEEIRQVYQQMDPARYGDVGSDGRVAVLRRR